MEDEKLMEERKYKNKLKRINIWLNTKRISLLWMIIIFIIVMLVFSILAIWTPWILLSLILLPIMTWIFTYEDKIISNFEMKSLEKESFQEVDIVSTLKEITVIINLRMDIYEILLLKYRRLKYRMLGINVIRFLIYVLFGTVIILIILSPNLTEFSGYWQIRSITSTVLSVLFGLYIKVDRKKKTVYSI